MENFETETASDDESTSANVEIVAKVVLLAAATLGTLYAVRTWRNRRKEATLVLINTDEADES